MVACRPTPQPTKKGGGRLGRGLPATLDSRFRGNDGLEDGAPIFEAMTMP